MSPSENGRKSLSFRRRRSSICISATVPFGQRSDQKGKKKNITQVAKGKPHAGKEILGSPLWARGYFAASSGNVTDEVIAEYIQLQGKQKRDRDDDFTIDGVESSSDDQV